MEDQGLALILILAEGVQKQAALCQENSLLALQTALATAEKKAALQVDPIVKESGVERSSVKIPIFKEMA